MPRKRIIIGAIFCPFFLLCFQNTNAKEVFLIKQDHRNSLKYRQYTTANLDTDTLDFKKFKEIQPHTNSTIEYPNSRIKHSAIGDDGKIEFIKNYSVNQFGFRKTFFNTKAQKNLILAGDSNIFGIGCNDDEVVSSQLAPLLPNYQIINMGMPGASGNSLLYFFEKSNIKKNVLMNDFNTVLLFDFSQFLMERMIGGKNFIRWGSNQPSYELDQFNKVVFNGFFKELWRTRFYQIINIIDYFNFFIPNLPRITQKHLELIAKIFLEIKKKFLLQTNQNNRFAILIDPFFIDDITRELTFKQIDEFHKLGLETIVFEKKVKFNDEIYPRDLHLNPNGHQIYANLIANKVKEIFK